MPFDPTRYIRQTQISGFDPSRYVVKPQLPPLEPMAAHRLGAGAQNVSPNPFQQNYQPSANVKSMGEIVQDIAPTPDQPFLERVVRGGLETVGGLASIPQAVSENPQAAGMELLKAAALRAKAYSSVTPSGASDPQATIARQMLMQEWQRNPTGAVLDIGGSMVGGATLPKTFGFLGKIRKATKVPEVIAQAALPAPPERKLLPYKPTEEVPEVIRQAVSPEPSIPESVPKTPAIPKQETPLIQESPLSKAKKQRAGKISTEPPNPVGNKMTPRGKPTTQMTPVELLEFYQSNKDDIGGTFIEFLDRVRAEKDYEIGKLKRNEVTADYSVSSTQDAAVRPAQSKQPWEMTKTAKQPNGVAGRTYQYDYKGKPVTSLRKPIEQMTRDEFEKAVFDRDIIFGAGLKVRTGKTGSNHGRGWNFDLAGKIHKSIVGDAPVGTIPASVLADYPDLAAKYGKQVEPPKGGSVELGALGTPSAVKAFAQGESELNKAWSGLVDQGMAAAGRYIPESIKRALAPSHNRSQAWMQAKDEYRFAKMQGIEETSQIAREAKKIISKDRFEQAYNYLDPTERGIERPIDLEPEETKALDSMRGRLRSMGQEAVEANILDIDTFTKNAETYLKRLYLKYEMPNGRAAKLFRQFRIRNTKGRVLETAAERTAAGIIRDPIYSFAKGTAALRHDIETAKLFKKVAEAPEFKNSIGDEWREGLAPKPIPQRKEFGALQGKYVEQGMYDDLMEMQKWWDKNTAGRLYDKLLGGWKFGKTVMNPSTWARNGWSSAIQADVIGGLSPMRLDIYKAAAKDMASKSGDFAELAQLGKLRRSTYAADISEFASFLDRGGNVSMMERMLDYMASGRKVSQAMQKLGGYYGGMEDFFKIAVYKYQKSLGKAHNEAINIAEKAIPDYRESTPFVNKVARFGIPFVKYPYKILPAVAEAAVKHPVRFGKYPLMIYMMNQYAKDQLGLSDEEYNRLSKTKKFSGSSSMLLPFSDKQGNPLVLDLTYNLPWGDALEHGSGFAGAAGLTESTNWGGRIMSMMNPLIKVPAEVGFNKSTFTGREIVNQRVDTPMEVIKKAAGHVYQQMSPPLAPGNYGWNEIYRTATGKKNYYGEEPSPTATLLKHGLGLKTSPINTKRETQMEMVDIKKNMDAISKVMMSTANNKSLSEDERRQRLQELYRRLMAEAEKLKSQQ